MLMCNYRYILIRVSDSKIIYGNDNKDICEQKAQEFKTHGGNDFVLAECLSKTSMKKVVEMVGM